MARSGQEALPKGRERIGVPSGEPRVIGRPIRIARTGRESLLEGRECLGGPLE